MLPADVWRLLASYSLSVGHALALCRELRAALVRDEAFCLALLEHAWRDAGRMAALAECQAGILARCPMLRGCFPKQLAVLAPQETFSRCSRAHQIITTEGGHVRIWGTPFSVPGIKGKTSRCGRFMAVQYSNYMEIYNVELRSAVRQFRRYYMFHVRDCLLYAFHDQSIVVIDMQTAQELHAWPSLYKNVHFSDTHAVGFRSSDGLLCLLTHDGELAALPVEVGDDMHIKLLEGVVVTLFERLRIAPKVIRRDMLTGETSEQRWPCGPSQAMFARQFSLWYCSREPRCVYENGRPLHMLDPSATRVSFHGRTLFYQAHGAVWRLKV